MNDHVKDTYSSFLVGLQENTPYVLRLLVSHTEQDTG
jgi:hypothetical protein